MEALRGVLGRLFKEDPRKEECAELASQLRGKMEGLLDDSDQISLSLTKEQAQKVNSPHWFCPVTIRIRRELHDLRFESSDEVLVLKGDNKLLIFDIGYEGTLHRKYAREGLVEHLIFDLYGLDDEVYWLRKWIGVTTRLEEYKKNPQAASPAPVAP